MAEIVKLFDGRHPRRFYGECQRCQRTDYLPWATEHGVRYCGHCYERDALSYAAMIDGGPVSRMTDIEWSQLRRAAAGENISSSDRPGDRARTKLKRLGLLEYNRKFARWLVTELGRSALAQSEEKK